MNATDVFHKTRPSLADQARKIINKVWSTDVKGSGKEKQPGRSSHRQNTSSSSTNLNE